MIQKHAGREFAKWVAVTLAVLLGLYVGAYYWLVTPIKAAQDTATETGYRVLHVVEPGYPRWSRAREAFFCPIHALDRHLRPDIWVPDKEIFRNDHPLAGQPEAEPRP